MRPALAALLLLLAGCAGSHPHRHHRRPTFHHHAPVAPGGFAAVTRGRCARGDRGACRMLDAMGGE